MARDFNYVTVDYIFSQLGRIPNYTLNENDVLTDISLALGFMFKGALTEEAVAILEVKNNIAVCNFGYSQIHRILKYDGSTSREEGSNLLKSFLNLKSEGCVDCEDTLDFEDTDDDCGCGGEDDLDFNECYLNLSNTYSFPFQTFYGNNLIRKKFSIVKPSRHSFFSSLVCNSQESSELYKGCQLEYSIQKGLQKRLLLSFSEGYIAVAYTRPITDDATGYPLIPDDSNANEAILAFTRAKIFEVLAYSGREGYGNLAIAEREKWGKYLKQFNNAAKMPQTEDDYQSQLETTLGSYPSSNQYKGRMAGLSRRRRRM